MAGQIRKAAAWLGIVPDERYDEDYDVDDAYDEYTEQFVDAEVEEAEPSTVTPINRDHGSRDQGSRDPGHRESRIRESAVVRREEDQPVAQTRGASVATTRSSRPEPVATDLSRIVTVNPRTYNEARTIGEHFRDGVPVIMNVSDMDDADAKRLIDFAAGLTFGLRGTIEKVTNRVFLLSPPNVNVTAEDKERIASGGFFNQS